MSIAESKGIILFSKNHKEKDKLVKIFTESAGKQMFYVRGAHRKNNPLAPALLPYTEAVYIGKFNSEGLSFLNSAKDVHSYRNIQADIFLAGYATYLLNLADAAIEDRVYDPNLYSFLRQALVMMDQGNDGEVLTNIFEIQILQRFGITINWQKCAVCGQTQGKFDYSSAYNGVLCEHHWDMDPRRYHAEPIAIHFIRLFSQITYDKIQTIELKAETKKAIRQTIDALYEEYVGVHLKSKKFIDQMGTWENMLQPQKSEPET
ncbi:DNA repair protein RecO [Enterococcus saccharolyticus]|uniref:DNA repair protein RecO n=1 Tax=Candidatus Enterococcus willemsii TaxID=1857215 RepID=A0ABQ6Z289_9ENTE|nr:MULTISPECIES: DNA repair protein RecO [Enterococcus]KAF1305547.1 DNA repair protein RecO [Enterococcus sp. CU12B]MCD5002695.1 DNA repair protein RecO [Enterococcus saccharolyticus]